ncbi:MAG: hypothetical protein K6G85_00440 [Eubacterium sp.]|nr:hypothetical protein [Eubacterium sp.]
MGFWSVVGIIVGFIVIAMTYAIVTLFLADYKVVIASLFSLTYWGGTTYVAIFFFEKTHAHIFTILLYLNLVLVTEFMFSLYNDVVANSLVALEMYGGLQYILYIWLHKNHAIIYGIITLIMISFYYFIICEMKRNYHKGVGYPESFESHEEENKSATLRDIWKVYRGVRKIIKITKWLR